MFSDQLGAAVRLARGVGSHALPSRAEVEHLLEYAVARHLDDDEIVALVAATRDPDSRALIRDFAASHRRPHDREILLLPPLYLSSICENACRYCNFSRDGERLDLDRFRREVEHLIGLGFRSIELVSSQDPALFAHAEGFALETQAFDVGPLLPYVECVAGQLDESGGGMLTTNIPPLDVESMRKLRIAGLDCFLVWQETFDPGQYGKLHVARGPKGNQAFRIDSMENASAAGIPHLAGAYLKGLFDWRREEVVLYLFDRHLAGPHGRGLSIVGTPRVKGAFAASPLIAPYGVSDEEYETAYALDRILFDGVPWLQTRESFDFNLRLISRYGGGVILTLVSSTAPGGYAAPASAEAQFPVFKQDLDGSVERLAAAGFSARFAWDADELDAFQRSRPGSGAAGED